MHLIGHYTLPKKILNLIGANILWAGISLRVRPFESMKELGIISEKYTLSERFHSVPAWNDLSDSMKGDWDLKMALYAGVMSNLYCNIGRLVSTLERKNQVNNTFILLLSDNGAC